MPGTTTLINGSTNITSGRQALALAGQYFTITNPTIGTPVVGATIIAWSATANGLFVIPNTAPVGGRSVVLDSLTLRLRATAPTGTLTMQFEAYNETGLVVGTTAVTTRTPVQGNAALPQTSVTNGVQAFAAGCITIPAAVGTRRLQDTATLTTGLGIDGDTYELFFGSDGVGQQKNGGAATRATDAAHICSQMGPITVAPQTTSWINMWWLTQATNIPSWEYNLRWAEL